MGKWGKGEKGTEDRRPGTGVFDPLRIPGSLKPPVSGGGIYFQPRVEADAAQRPQPGVR